MASEKLETIRALIHSGNLEEARDQLIDILYEDYDNLEAWLLLTDCAHDREEYKRAVREALRIAPDDPTARRLAMSLARRVEPSGEGRQRQSTNRAIQSLFNLILLFAVIAVGTAIAFFLIAEQSGSSSSPTLEPAVAIDLQCQSQIDAALRVLEARCGLQPSGSACLANPRVEFSQPDANTSIQLAGDRISLEQLTAIETEPLDIGVGEWGLVIVNASDDVQIVVTSGVRVSDFTPSFDSAFFSSNPVLSECDSLPPSGLLISSQVPHSIVLNDVPLIVNGIAFTQVDVSGGLRVFALSGSVDAAGQALTIGQSIEFDVNELLHVDDTTAFQREDVTLRGNLDTLAPLVPLISPDPVVLVAEEPTQTPTNTFTPSPTTGIRILSPTPSSTQAPRTATLRPTQTPTNTSVPTSTNIPTGIDSASITQTPIAIAEDATITLAATQLNCIFAINDSIINYQIILEPTLDGVVRGTALLPAYDNTVVLLSGLQINTADELDTDWARLPNYTNAVLWLLLQEDEILYSDIIENYLPNGVFRLIVRADDTVSGGIFVDQRLIGIVEECTFQN